MRHSRKWQVRPLPQTSAMAFLVGLGAILGLGLTACARGVGNPTPTVASVPLHPSPHLKQATVGRLFGDAGSFLVVESGHEVIALTCTVSEGTFCWFGEDEQSGSLAREFAHQVIDELGGLAVEQANQNQVAIRCSRPVGQDAAITCEADWGWGGGWEPLAVE